MADCGHKVPCGCNDIGNTTPAPCGDGINCPDANPCSEVFCAECIKYCGDTVSFGTGISEIKIEQGDSYNIVMQKLLLYTIDETCASTVPFGLEAVDISSTQLTVKWLNNTGALTITLTDGVSPIVQPVTGVAQYTFINLTAETTYNISIAVDGSACQSLTLETKTKGLL
jgi:hypothetical protein